MDISVEWVRSEAPYLLVLLATSLVFVGERRVHKYNYAYLTTVGAEELIPGPMQTYYRWVLFLPWLAFASARLLPDPWVLKISPFYGLALIMFGFVLKLWSMRTLGRLWSQRCLYIPEMPRCDSGPYHFFKHPEYLARAIEGFGFLIFFGLNPLAGLIWLRTQIQLGRLVKTEARQLEELSAAPLHLPEHSSRVGASKL